jgi:hypothetical protein
MAPAKAGYEALNTTIATASDLESAVFRVWVVPSGGLVTTSKWLAAAAVLVAYPTELDRNVRKFAA